MYKIAVIDKENAIYSILDEQKEFFVNYTWFHFESIKKFTEIKNKEIKDFCETNFDSIIFCSIYFYKLEQNSYSRD